MTPFTLQNKFLGILITISLISLCGFSNHEGVQQVIIFQNEQSVLAPKEFYIIAVTDNRQDKSALGWILPVTKVTNNATPPCPVNLQGSGVLAVKQYIERNVVCDYKLRPLSIAITKFNITEAVLTNGTIQGKVNLEFTFSLAGSEDLVKLSDFNSSIVYTRDSRRAVAAEPILRNLLKSGLLYINGWMNKQAANNIKLAKRVKLTFGDYTENIEGDTIYYTAHRPLSWGDFQSKIPSSRYEAEVAPTIGYDESSAIENSVIDLKINVKVCLAKSACWAMVEGQTDDALNHEQRHFDIAKIVAERFKVNLKAQQLPVSNFDGWINVAYLNTYREMDELQKKYDNETAHGINRQEQQRWDALIDVELLKYK